MSAQSRRHEAPGSFDCWQKKEADGALAFPQSARHTEEITQKKESIGVIA